MASNGQTRERLTTLFVFDRVIASIFLYDKYHEAAETVVRMRRSSGGYRGDVFRSGVSNTMTTRQDKHCSHRFEFLPMGGAQLACPSCFRPSLDALYPTSRRTSLRRPVDSVSEI
jgi:hypothetical protein